MNAHTKYLLLAGMLLLVACGGGSDPEPPPQQQPFIPDKLPLAIPEGSWSATWTEPVTAEEKTARAYVRMSGDWQIAIGPAKSSAAQLAPGGPFVASIEKATLSSPSVVTTIGLGEGPGTAVASYSFTGGRLEAKVEHANKTYAISLQRDSVSPSRISPAALSGVYSGNYGSPSGTTQTWTLTIQEGGRITGSDTYGCNWSGTADTSSSGLNAFKLVMDATGCPSSGQAYVPVSGRYVAMGRIAQPNASRTLYPNQNIVEFSIVGPVWLGSQVLAK